MQRKSLISFPWFILTYIPVVICTKLISCIVVCPYDTENFSNLFLRLPVKLAHMNKGKQHRGELMSRQSGRRLCTPGASLSSSDSTVPTEQGSQAWTDYSPQRWGPSSTMLHTSVLSTAFCSFVRLFVFSEDPTPHSVNSSCCGLTVLTGLHRADSLVFWQPSQIWRHLQFSVS